MNDDGEPEGRLSRWSKRKIAIAKEQVREEAPVAEIISPDELDAQQLALEAEHEANRQAAEAVDLETLNEDSDFSVFMKNGVPDMLKKQAMASLWRSSPVFANIDGLVDYDDDFGSPDLIMKTFKSAYQAGRGYLDQVKENLELGEEAEVELDIAASDQVEHANDDEEELPEPAEIEEADEEVDEAGDAPDLDQELEIAEETSPPKISLRKRYELDPVG